MHLKSLTLKGFKSFASATTLRFEPGITCVVGPNGSGKSNVVDALTWVMGEQGAKVLRGGKMQDVIFAGTADRAPLGRAEVTLTIDNSDGALPIEYSEVSITRRMFRDGAGEYEINGNSCRLMDVQELLSDSGIGREMHVIVGQGQLSAILESRPEERRAFIEEAAGVLKHRRRKEKAVRKLDAMQANLARLTDLTGELRRQLKPLARQAEVARRAQTIQADLRDARLRLAADDLVTRRAELAEQSNHEDLIRAQRTDIEAALAVATAELAAYDEALAQLGPAAESANHTWFNLSALSERTKSTVRIARERVRHLTAAHAVETRINPDELEAQADVVAAEEQQLRDALDSAAHGLGLARAALAECEQAAQAAEREHLAAVRAVADRREGLARLSGQVDTLRARSQSVDAEVGRLTQAIGQAQVRGDAATAEFEAMQTNLAELDDEEAGFDSQHEHAVAALAVADERVLELIEAEKAAGQLVASLAARIDALSISLQRKDGANWIVENHGDSGILGPLAELLVVDRGFEAAIANALGPAADAVAARSAASAGEAIAALRAADKGRAAIVFGGTGPLSIDRPKSLPDAAVWALDVVKSDTSVSDSVAAVLSDVVIVADLWAAIDLVNAAPGVRAVTKDGELVGAGWIVGGVHAAASQVELRSAIEQHRADLSAAERKADELAAALSGALTEQTQRREAVEDSARALHESDSALNAQYEQLGHLGEVARLAQAEVERLTRQREQAQEGLSETRGELAELEARLHNAQREGDDSVHSENVHGQAGTHEERRAASAAAVATARTAEVEARLKLRTAEERANSIRGKADGMRRTARAERANIERARRAQRARELASTVAIAVAESGELVLAQLERVAGEAVSERDRLAQLKTQSSAGRNQVATTVRGFEAELAKLNDAAHRDELARTQAALRLEQVEASIAEQFSIGLDDLIAEYGPEVELPPTALEIDEYERARELGETVVKPAPMPYDRATQERRAQRAKRDLDTLGKVNPLALEEFAALEERYTFLSTQLEDVKQARKDLLDVVSDVDEQILRVFTEAYADVEREFSSVFQTLFPGGDGRLVLTDPGDMLMTGIEVEARPPGKKVKRLSLLSGGEKSLTAIAFLVAIFRARPSPFYVMDEVEAALDDTNLRRLLALFERIRESSQLIVITHQKPTMEIADALYGVSMRGDGITTVISQRMGAASAAAAAR